MSADNTSNGTLVLAGGAEFGGKMALPDLRALELAGGLDIPVRILPTAAAPDRNHLRAGENGVRWFTSLGASDVLSVAVIDRASADYPILAEQLRKARLIYLLGGFPGYLANTLADSLCWQAVLQAWQQGAVIAGSSAGAMVLCETLYDPYDERLLPGLNLLPGTCFLPHHNNFGRQWAPELLKRLPGVSLVGVDERTALINDQSPGWRVYGAGSTTIYAAGKVTSYRTGETVPRLQMIE